MSEAKVTPARPRRTPVRTRSLEVSRASFAAGEAVSVPLIELREG